MVQLLDSDINTREVLGWKGRPRAFETAGQYCCRRAIMFTVFNVITTSSV